VHGNDKEGLQKMDRGHDAERQKGKIKKKKKKKCSLLVIYIYFVKRDAAIMKYLQYSSLKSYGIQA
jgi:hypothetical protein